jgi:hypothetical protein
MRKLQIDTWRIPFASGVLVAALALASCGGGSGQEPPPGHLSYPGPTTAVVGVALSPLAPTVTGIVTEYTVGPALPAGLRLDPYTGVISGTPTASIAAATYTVVAHNDFGFASFALGLGVDNPVAMLGTLDPESVAAESPGLALTVTGTAIQPGASLLWNGQALGAISVSGTQVSVNVPPALLHTIGSVPVSVRNPPPGGGDAPPLMIHVAGPLRLGELADGSAPNAGAIDSALSADGRYVAFASASTDLVASDGNGAYDVFVRDTCIGMSAACTPSTLRASVANDGTEANAASGYTTDNPELGVAISGTGRYVAFVSAATNLAPGDTNAADDIFVRDTCFGAAAGCTPRTTLVSVALGGGPANGQSVHPAISRSGRFVAFASWASNLVAGDTNGNYDVFVRDTCAGAPAGCVPLTSRASVDDSGVQGNGDSLQPAFSGNERYLAFESAATNLVANDGNAMPDIFLRDTCFGGPAGCVASTRLVSLATNSTQANSRAVFPKPSHDGRYVSFISEATNLVPIPGPNGAHAFLRDTCVGAGAGCVPGTWLESEGTVWKNSMSDDARYMSFESSDLVFAPSDPKPVFNVLVRDTCVGATSSCQPHTTRVSISNAGPAPDNSSQDPAMSADGRLVSFTSYATNLLPAGAPQSAYGNIYVTETH